MKAIIPVAGAGTNLRPYSYIQPKALVPLAGKSVLSIIIEQAIEAGVNEFIFIVGYLGDKIRDHVAEKFPQIQAHYVQQLHRQGVGHAIKMAREITQNDEVLVILGDTICEYNIQELVESPHSVLGVRKVDNPRDFGVAEIEDDGFISFVVEKPQIPKSNMALVGIYKIKETGMLFDCLAKNIEHGLRSPQGYTLTDALHCMIKQGVKFVPLRVDNWFDCGRKDTLLASNATLLKKYASKQQVENNFENTVIVPPVSIAQGCIIKNAIIGPNVSVGENAKINYAIIKNSIIGSFSNLYDIVLSDSVIGSDTGLKGESRKLDIGDNTHIDLG